MIASIKTDLFKKKRLIYILSPSFSGSTLMTLLLAQHTEISTIGELKATAMGITGEYICSCESNIHDCEFWKKLTKAANEKNIPFSTSKFGTHFTSENKFYNAVLNAQVRGVLFEKTRLSTIKTIPNLHSEYQKIIKQNKSIIDISTDLLGGELFLDGSKDSNRLLYLMESGNWSIDVIRMHRDGRAQSHSRRKKENNPIDFETATKEWAHTIQQMDYVSSKVDKERLITINYEDLCAAPNEILASIWEFLKIEPIDRDWRIVDLKSKTTHILGNNMRTQKRINIQLDEKWKSQLSDNEIASFEKHAGDTNRRLGYSI